MSRIINKEFVTNDDGLRFVRWAGVMDLNEMNGKFGMSLAISRNPIRFAMAYGGRRPIYIDKKLSFFFQCSVIILLNMSQVLTIAAQIHKLSKFVSNRSQTGNVTFIKDIFICLTIYLDRNGFVFHFGHQIS